VYFINAQKEPRIAPASNLWNLLTEPLGSIKPRVKTTTPMRWLNTRHQSW